MESLSDGLPFDSVGLMRLRCISRVVPSFTGFCVERGIEWKETGHPIGR